jgi:N6-adenosine-specific RNA methylase IME4
MTLDEIAALPVASLAATTARSTSGPSTPTSRTRGTWRASWGFEPSTLCVWAKNPMGGGLGGSFGITTEFFLYARAAPREHRTIGTWFNWKRHYINGKPAHSAKPDAFYDLVETATRRPARRVVRPPRAARLGLLGRRIAWARRRWGKVAA